MSGFSDKSLAVRLAVADFRFEARVSLCLVLALAAVMTPLLVLFGLKSGMVQTLQQRLLADPANLEVVVVGSQRFTPEWLAALAKRPETGFSVARTRSLSATLDVRTADGKAFPGLEMVPSAAGDPLLPAGVVPPAGRAALLSATAAARLGVGVGDSLTAQVTRTVNGETQAARFPLSVGGIVPETAFPRAAVFVALDLLVETEDFRDGLAALGATGEAKRTAPRRFAGVRLYARDLDAVAPLAQSLRAEGMEVRTRAAEIESVRAIDRVLSLIVGVLAAIGASGFLLSLGASLWANVERKRRDLALLRLIGFSGGAAALFPAVQALLVAALGCLLSGAVYLLVAWGFDAALGANLGENEFVCRLPAGDYLAAVAATLAAALAAASLAGRRAAKVDPAEGLRDV
jgi:putative ABC transport system permease protein